MRNLRFSDDSLIFESQLVHVTFRKETLERAFVDIDRNPSCTISFELSVRICWVLEHGPIMPPPNCELLGHIWGR